MKPFTHKEALMNALQIENETELQQWKDTISEVTFAYILQQKTLDEPERNVIEKLQMLFIVLSS